MVDNQDLTLRMRRHLLEAARGHRKVTYGELMLRFRLSRGSLLTNLIGKVDGLEYIRGAPGFASIIVRKDTGYPGGGYFCDDDLPKGLRRPRDKSTDPKLSDAEKKHVEEQQRRIWAYYSARSGAKNRP